LKRFEVKACVVELRLQRPIKDIIPRLQRRLGSEILVDQSRVGKVVDVVGNVAGQVIDVDGSCFVSPQRSLTCGRLNSRGWSLQVMPLRVLANGLFHDAIVAFGQKVIP